MITETEAQPQLVLPKTPCDFDPEFLADLPYDPSVLLFDRILELDPVAQRVRCRMPTDQLVPFMDRQRVHPKRHPRHYAGGALVHSTGMLGFVHAYYLLGLRHHAGWIGYGTHIHSATFRKLVEPGTPIECTCVATRQKRGRSRVISRYSFEYRHEGEVCYEGDQSAMWTRVD